VFSVRLENQLAKPEDTAHINISNLKLTVKSFPTNFAVVLVFTFISLNLNLMSRLKQKLALVTGAGRGIGAEIARKMSNEGATVLVADINLDSAEKVANKITANIGNAMAIYLDVTVEDSWLQAIQKITDQFGSLDILVNNAGIVLCKDIEDATLEEWNQMVAVNMTSVFLGTRLCAPALRIASKQSLAGSSIINLSSVAGLVAAPNDALYAMTKGGVTLFTKSTAITFANKGDRIRVNAIHPGFIETEMADQVIQAQAQRLGETDHDRILKLAADRHPVGHIGQPSDIASGAVFLASDEAGFMTGSSLVIDGGYTAQ
jgi:3(or 17)beta-hydroxysteroid dehydrogenase